MRKIRFNGVYKDLLEEFVQFKRQCGFKYVTAEKMLVLFHNLTNERGETETSLGIELARAWAVKRPNETASYRFKRSVVFNQFALYLRQQDRPCSICHVPP